MVNAVKVRKSLVGNLVKVAHPEYRGRKYRVSTGARVMFYSTHWSEGSKNTYVAVRLTDGAKATLDVGTSPWNCPTEGRTVEIPTDVAIVEHSIFCGRDGGITVHVHPDCPVGRLARQLPGARPELTAEQRTAAIVSWIDSI